MENILYELDGAVVKVKKGVKVARGVDFKVISYTNPAENIEEEEDDLEPYVRDLVEQLKARVEKDVADRSGVITKAEDYEKMEAMVMKQQLKLQMCVPISMIMALIGVVCLFVVPITTAVCQILMNAKIIDYYILFFIALCGIGLTFTSISTIKDWKRYMANE